MNYYNSQYNFYFQVEGGFLLYNAKTGATIELKGQDSQKIGDLMAGSKQFFANDFFDDGMMTAFIRKGFLVKESNSELFEIRERYWSARGNSPIVLTITTTMNCNLGCYYCYEERTEKKLDFTDTKNIINHLKIIFKDNPKRSLHVDWYGGEPLLNIKYLEKASEEIQHFCKNNKINYHSSIISNGTLWPSDIEKFIQQHKIRQVQISFDGLKENHNKRRRYRRNHLKGEDNSYDVIMDLVDNLLDIVHVDVRFNIDWRNKNDVYEFLNIIIKKGWFKKKYPAVFQPARLSSYSEKSSFMKDKQLSIEEFDTIRANISDKLKNIGKIEESEVPDGFPFPKTHVCAALASDSFVVGADKHIYRCGLQVGEINRAVGTLSSNNSKTYKDNSWWNDFDPTTLDSCSKCSFLPICFGGCPKNHLEKQQDSMDEQGKYWRNNLSKKVSGYLSKKLVDELPIKKDLQFRNGFDN